MDWWRVSTSMRCGLRPSGRACLSGACRPLWPLQYLLTYLLTSICTWGNSWGRNSYLDTPPYSKPCENSDGGASSCGHPRRSHALLRRDQLCDWIQLAWRARHTKSAKSCRAARASGGQSTTMSGCDVCAVVVEAASLCVWVHMGANSLRGAWIVCAPNLWSAARVSPVRCLLMPVSCMSSLRTNHHMDGAEQLASLQVRAWVCGTVIGMMAAWISGRPTVRALARASARR